MRTDDNMIDKGLVVLDELYILINVDNAHWIFIKAVMHAKTIQLFDSQGEVTTTTSTSKPLKTTCTTHLPRMWKQEAKFQRLVTGGDHNG